MEQTQKSKQKITNFQDLIVWKIGHSLVVDIYKITTNFPKSEMYGLSDQIRRCTVSITSNIAEGFSRFNIKGKLQFFRISLGSITELQNQLIIAKDIGYIDTNKFKEMFDRSISVLKLLNALVAKTKSKFQILNSKF